MGKKGTPILLDESIENYKESLINRECSPNTILSYTNILQSLSDYLSSEVFNGEVALEQVDLHCLQQFMEYRKKVRKNSAKTLNSVYITLRAFFNYLTDFEMVSTNPALKLPPVKVPKKERVYLTQQEAKRFMEAITNPLIYSVCAAMLYGGLRISEVCKLKKSEVDFESSIIHVIEGKGRKDRAVPMGSLLRTTLLDYAQKYADRDSELFFATHRTGKICNQYINEKIDEYRRKAGIEKYFTAHCLRHTFATNLVSHNANIHIVSEIMGHNDVRTTSIYLHCTAQDALDTIEECLKL